GSAHATAPYLSGRRAVRVRTSILPAELERGNEQLGQATGIGRCTATPPARRPPEARRGHPVPVRAYTPRVRAVGARARSVPEEGRRPAVPGRREPPDPGAWPRPAGSALHGQDQRQHPGRPGPPQQARRDREGPAGLRVVVHGEDRASSFARAAASSGGTATAPSRAFSRWALLLRDAGNASPVYSSEPSNGSRPISAMRDPRDWISTGR